MTNQTKGPNPDGPALLTVSEFIKLAGDRGKKLWIETSRDGNQRITDGAKRYLIPNLPGGLIPPDVVEVLVVLFRQRLTRPRLRP
jgi:hypothetical protein